LTVAVGDLANRTTGRLNDLTKAIGEATKQAEQSSEQSSETDGAALVAFLVQPDDGLIAVLVKV
jgi:hypothetical protein